MKPGFKVVNPLIIAFVICTMLIGVSSFLFTSYGVNYVVLIGGNCLFFLISLLVFRMQYKAMQHSNPNVFIRAVMLAMIIKFVACISAVIGYYFISKEAFSKPAVYFSMVIYVIYLVVEVRTIMKLNKSKHA